MQRRLFQVYCRILAVQHAQKTFYFCQNLIMIFGVTAQWRTWEGILRTAALSISFIVTVFARVSMNLNMTIGQAACQLLCRYTQSPLAASWVCWIVPIATCDSIKRTCGCSCLKCTWSVGITDEPPPAKLNVKTGPLRSLYFGICYSFGFSRLLFFFVFRSVFRWFWVFV